MNEIDLDIFPEIATRIQIDNGDCKEIYLDY